MFAPLKNCMVRRCCSASTSSSATAIAVFPNASLPPPPFSSTKTRPFQQHLPEKAGTTVLLVHGGEPRTNFYARRYLSRVLVDRLRLPKWVGKLIADFYFAYSSFPARCIADSVHFPPNSDQLQWLKHRLETALSRLLPEFGPFRCLPATAQEDHQNNVEPQLHRAIRHGMDHLLLFPLQQKWRTRPLLSSIKKTISAFTNQMLLQQHIEQNGFFSSPNGVQQQQRQKQRQFVVPNLPVSFSLLVADELQHIAWTDTFVQYWVERILPLFAHYRVIIFMAARPTPIDQLEHVARRVMHALYRHSPLATPWRCAVHYAWDQPFGNWVDSLALMRWRRHTLARCVHRLRKKGVAGPFLVVPLDSMMECFDVHTTLPSLIASLEGTSRNMVHLLPTRPLADDNALVHSLAEFVKHMMLNPQKFCLSANEE